METVFYVVLGYFCGSILFARLNAKIFGKPEIITQSPDGNPGTFNAFAYGGFLCGVLTLIGDLAKGYLPVMLYMRRTGVLLPEGLPLVLAAPVVGHAFPLFHRLRGGKGIAVTFGCLLGLTPWFHSVWFLAFWFVFFSLIVKVSPNMHRTFITYLFTALTLAVAAPHRIALVFAITAVVVTARLVLSPEEKEKWSVVPIWKR